MILPQFNLFFTDDVLINSFFCGSTGFSVAPDILFKSLTGSSVLLSLKLPIIPHRSGCFPAIRLLKTERSSLFRARRRAVEAGWRPTSTLTEDCPGLFLTQSFKRTWETSVESTRELWGSPFSPEQTKLSLSRWHSVRKNGPIETVK